MFCFGAPAAWTLTVTQLLGQARGSPSVRQFCASALHWSAATLGSQVVAWQKATALRAVKDVARSPKQANASEHPALLIVRSPHARAASPRSVFGRPTRAPRCAPSHAALKGVGLQRAWLRRQRRLSGNDPGPCP